MREDFRERLQGVRGYDTKIDTAKSIITTAEDMHEVLREVKRLRRIEELRDQRSKEQSNRRQVDTSLINNVRFNVYEYDSSYIGDLRYTTAVYHAQQLGMRLRSLEIELQDGEVTVESGMFQSSEGQIELSQSFSPMHMIGGIVRRMNKETFFRPEFKGTGRVRLESNFKFVKLLKVPRKTRLVLEKGIYLASAGKWKYKTAKNFNVGMMFFSNKAILQTELAGSGLVALELPVHPTELVEHVVTEGNPFRVNGEYVLYWAGNLKRKIHPARKLLGNLASGRGIVEEYTGRGFVYTAPTLGFYSHIANELQGKNTSVVHPLGDGVDLGKPRRTWRDWIGMRGSRD